MVDESILVSILDSVASMLPSLVGTLIGGGVTLLAARMTIRHQNELEDKKRRLTLEDDWRQYERENLTRLQETIQHSMRANFNAIHKCWSMPRPEEIISSGLLTTMILKLSDII